MKCDIIIPIWNQLEMTRSCIEHIFKNTHYPYRLILIDNASDAETKRYLEGVKYTKQAEIELIRNEENMGFVKAVNQGLKLSSAPYVCILNNDTIPATRWLERMLEFAESHKDVGLINPQCDGHGDMSMDIYAELLYDNNKGEFMEMNQCQGFCMLIKKEVIDRIGYLDESFGIGGYDDTDYSMRAHLAGYRCVAIKGAYVYHHQHTSFNKAGNREDWVSRNRKIYYNKWGRHLRIGMAVNLETLDDKYISRLIKLAYGLAREWSWVHVWINSKIGNTMINDSIKTISKRDGLAPHQNIKINYFNLPARLFELTITGKLLERLCRGRMRDKRFDALILFDKRSNNLAKFASRIVKIETMDISLEDALYDWVDRGKGIAASIKGKMAR